MPDFVFSFTVQNITSQKATAIRDRLGQLLNTDQIQTAGLGFTRETITYRAIGVDTSNSQVFDETTEAPDQQTAAQQIIGTSTTKVIALIRPVSP